MTFKVDARRAKKSYPANSMEINCEARRSNPGGISGNEGRCS